MTGTMPEYPQRRTALIVIDATNDFISEGGKAWPQLKDVIEAVGTLQRQTIELNWPRYARHIRTTAELISALGVDPSVAEANA